MKKLWIAASLAIVVSPSCTRKVYIPVETVKTIADSAARVAVRTDSVWLRDSVVVLQRGDTVRERVVRDRVRTVLRRDTLWRVRSDTVRVHAASPPGSGASGGGSYAGWLVAAVLAAVLALGVCFSVKSGRSAKVCV